MRSLATVALMLVTTSLAASTPRNASIPVADPSGTRIAFQSERGGGKSQIYTMAMDGSDVRPVTRSDYDDMGADWSRDGKRLVFCSYTGDDKAMEIVVVDVDGSHRRTVARGPDAAWPRIAPNGAIAFSGENAKGERRIFMTDVRGRAVREVDTGLPGAWNPAWSRDGKQLLFTDFPAAIKTPASAETVVYVADREGGHRRRVGVIPGVAQLPRWSPKGDRVAFQTWTGGRDVNIVVLDLASGHLTALTHNKGTHGDETPSWLPDGRLLFQSDRDGSYEVYVMNADGSGQRRLSR